MVSAFQVEIYIFVARMRMLESGEWRVESEREELGRIPGGTSDLRVNRGGGLLARQARCLRC